ncbi:c-type cytochrome [Oceanibacterium hippocampi]|uniref:Cytochrome c-552 n=1 Tax=Oceanibacterium hippocampi TaxID=745714 RepID=A0A1Y5RTY9_9PROT|nr:cytochrome c family protein [Oceanibacterium hippocampi]SLN25213.1 Cytochrome c-552 [Oceanibacterium hippocampi]
MDSFELNKFIGAFLFCLLITVGLVNLSGILVHPTIPDQPGYVIEVAESSDADGDATEEEAGPSLAVLLSEGDAAKGEKVAKKCASCHSFEEGGPNKVGPNLYGVLMNARGVHSDFAYSDALKSHPGEWTYEDLDHFLANPKGFIQGTKMAFAGLKKPGDRADLILYLRSLGDQDVPLPAAE